MKNLRFGEAFIVLVLMIAFLGISVIGYGLMPQIPVLIVISALIFWLALIKKVSFDAISDSIVNGIKTAIVPIFIFILIGALIAVWIQSGIIPSMMVAAFHMISVHFFVPSVFIVCSIVGLAIGSGFTTVSTIGIALLGMGMTLGINPALTCGAIVSGAVFGDKMSPISDSTNLASAIGEVDLFDHIQNMMWSTIPAFLCSLLLFALLGYNSHSASLQQINQTTAVLNSHFHISFLALVPILVMLVFSIIKVPAIPSLLLNIWLTAGLIKFSDPHFSFKQLADLLQNGFVSKTHNQVVDSLMTRGGISSMMGTISLIILTLALGGILMDQGIISKAMEPLTKRLRSPLSTITATILSGIGINLFVGEQYLSVILPGNAFKPVFAKNNLSPLALSRTLEDGGSVINYIIPWGVAGSFVAATLGTPVMHFLPFVFFSLFSPIFSILSGLTGIGLKKIK
ncbi:MAG: Na+/H+ antiporter NhaC [Lactobacillus sp.]|nr:Na+/H+ antiporter NhaC [Lactobacillus sp.]